MEENPEKFKKLLESQKLQVDSSTPAQVTTATPVPTKPDPKASATTAKKVEEVKKEEVK